MGPGHRLRRGVQRLATPSPRERARLGSFARTPFVAPRNAPEERPTGERERDESKASGDHADRFRAESGVKRR
jgi:hypothetical protein